MLNRITFIVVLISIDHWSTVNCVPSPEFLARQKFNLLQAINQTNYDKNKPPMIDDNPALVNVSLTVHQILQVNEAEQSITLDLFVDTTWRDDRIKTPDDLQHFTLDTRWQSQLWLPRIFFANSLDARIVDMTSSPLYFEISRNNQLTMSSRAIIKLACHMDLFYFPQDTQLCSIDMAYVTNSNHSVQLIWENFNVTDKEQYSKFEVTNLHQEECETFRGPDYPCLRAKIRLFRRISYYIIRIYAPSFVLVITSFISFWVPVLGYPARIALGATPLLSLITQQTQINGEINVSYVVAIHIWMMSSVLFVFLSLVEFALAIVYVHHVDELKEISTSNMFTERLSRNSLNTPHAIKIVLNKIYGEIDWRKAPLDRNKVDYCARILFPLTYAAFIIIYCSIFIFPWLTSKYM